MLCRFVPLVVNGASVPDWHVCTRCGDRLNTPNGNIVAQCHAKEESSGPGAIRRFFNFAIALTSHVGDGLKKRDRAEIEGLLTICQTCTLYDAARQACTHPKCGCGVSREEKFFNKLAWKSEHCPINKW